MTDTTLGIIALAAPLLIVGAFALRRMPWILAFFVALVAVGIGYLDTTGATRDIGHTVRATLPAGLVPEHKHAEEAAPANEGAGMKAETPPPAAAPAETPAAETPPAETPTPAADTTPETPASPAPETNPDAAPAPAPAPAPTNP